MRKYKFDINIAIQIYLNDYQFLIWLNVTVDYYSYFIVTYV